VADDEYAVARRVAAALEELGVEYTLGGSLASSIHGEPRSTNDIDFAVRLEERHVSRFVERLGSDFVLEEDVIGILRITGSALDRIYLERWADQLGVRDLLKQAFEQT
jgi:hypothetical protein